MDAHSRHSPGGTVASDSTPAAGEICSILITFLEYFQDAARSNAGNLAVADAEGDRQGLPDCRGAIL
jgi:hypothetical protein